MATRYSITRKILARILSDDLPLETALRAASAGRQVLQTNGRVSLIAPTLLKGFARITGGAEINRNECPSLWADDGWQQDWL